MALGDDIRSAWTHPDASAVTRKAILRAVLEEIVVTLADGRIGLLLHWRAATTRVWPCRATARASIGGARARKPAS